MAVKDGVAEGAGCALPRRDNDESGTAIITEAMARTSVRAAVMNTPQAPQQLGGNPFFRG